MTQTHSPSTLALQALMCGEAVIFPTDTVFGLGVSVQHAPSPEILYQIKQRSEHKPIAWLVDSISALDTYGKDIPSSAYVLAKTFWPGPLTIIVKANEKVANAFLSERGTVGMRMPGGEIATDLIARLGCPIATTSANISGHANACSFDELEPEILSKVAVALSDGEVKRGIASTVVDCSLGERPVLLREGTITESDIASLFAKSSLV